MENPIKKLVKKPLAVVCILLMTLLIILGTVTAVRGAKLSQLRARLAVTDIQKQLLSEDLVRASSELVDQKELRKWAYIVVNDNVALRADLAELRAKPTSITYVIADTGGSNTEEFRPDEGASNEEVHSLAWIPDILEYRTPSGLLVGEHRINRDDAVFDATTHNLAFKTVTVISTTRDGATTSHTQVAVTSSGEPDNPIALVIKEAETKFVHPTDRKMLVAPHLNVGAGVGGDITNKIGAVSANLGISFFAYGRTHSDNTLRFVNLRGEVGTEGAGDDARLYIGVGLDLLLVNIGEPLPLLDDLWIGVGPTIFVAPQPDVSAPRVGGGVGLTITSTI